MVGQNELLKSIKRQIQFGTFPRFVVLCGAGELDKQELCKSIADELGASLIGFSAPKADVIREAIAEAYRQRIPTVYAFLKFDTVSAQAKNALLKLTEEPPNKAYIIIGVDNRDNLLKTLKSRAAIYDMQHYTTEELSHYVDCKYRLDAGEKQKVFNVCETPDEIDLLLNNYRVRDFYDYVELVVDNIAEVSGANSFKIAEKLNLKEDNGKYDLALFFKIFMVICAERYKEFRNKTYFEWVGITSKALSDLQRTSLNKQMLVDTWILDIRKAWL